MKIKTFQGGYDKNLCYLVWCNKTKQATLIDASVEINPIIEYLEANNLILSKILVTHTHHDHISYIYDLIKKFPLVNILCYHKPINKTFKYQGLRHNEMITIGDKVLIAMHTPGHFFDSMCFWNKDNNLLFTGDTMFVGRTGRTISQSSNLNDLYDSIYQKILILPRKTIFQLCSLLEDYEGDVKISNIKSKIKFELNNSILISKLIDGKFPNYVQVIPKENQKKLEVDLKSFLDSVDHVASVSLDKKDGVKFNLSKDILNLSVNSNSADGKMSLNVKFDHDLDISFNSRYLIDVASQLDGDKIEIYFKDTGSPALIKDPDDFDSIFVVMPMKG